ncbi:MAG: hypothetical protein IPP61_16725 [Cytophagaceae bacterium]|nr:hypothetical protein [Cytophagaceae bacterium]MBL0303975.1 hypothetical protein [Cytophagaceae bacterium]MBL0326787.1 hypothetical protein [Cytophagaceae bacterium]
MLKESESLNKIARIISFIGNPMTLGLLVVLYIQFFHQGSPTNHLLLYLMAIVVIPIGSYIKYQVNRKNFRDYDVSHQKRRNSLYQFALVLIFVLMLVLYFLNVPADLQLIIRILFMHLFLSFIVNQWIKVSMHTSFNFLFALMMIPTNLYFGIGLMGYGFVNGWSRVQLSRHKPREVIAGLLLGNFTGTLFLYFLKSIE